MKKISFFIIPFLFFAFFSCEEILLEDDISDEIVQLVAPVNNADFYSTGLTLTWDPIENGKQYRIQIARPNFAHPIQIVVDEVTEKTSYSTQLNIGQYEWRIQAFNSGYSTVYSTRSFTIVSNEDFQNNTVTLLSPLDVIITNAASQNLKWEEIIGATGYHVQAINLDNNNITLEQDVTVENFNYTFPQGNFQWKVRATNGEQNTLYASRSLLVDTTSPNTPVLTTPANASTITDDEVTFQWTRTSSANGSEEKDSIYIYKNVALTNLQYEGEQTSPYNSELPNGTYYWFVKSFDEAGNVSQQSTVFSFTIN